MAYNEYRGQQIEPDPLPIFIIPLSWSEMPQEARDEIIARQVIDGEVWACVPPPGGIPV